MVLDVRTAEDFTTQFDSPLRSQTLLRVTSCPSCLRVTLLQLQPTTETSPFAKKPTPTSSKTPQSDPPPYQSAPCSSQNSAAHASQTRYHSPAPPPHGSAPIAPK